MLVATARSLADLFVKCGVEVPQQARDVLACAAAAAAGMSRSGGEDLRLAIRSGELTPKNVVERVDAAADLNARRPGYAALISECDAEWGNMALQSLRGDPTIVLDQLRPRFMETAAVVVDGAQYFDADSFADPGRVLAKRPAAVDAYAALPTAMERLEEMSRLVAQVCRFDVLRLPAAAFFIESSPPAGLPQFGGENRWLALYGTTGVVPALNTPDAARAIVAAAQAAVAELSRRPRTRLEQMREDSAKREAASWQASVGSPSQ